MRTEARPEFVYSEWKPEPQKPPARPVAERTSPVGDQLTQGVEAAVSELERQRIDLTTDYNDWKRIGLSLAAMGETGRAFFHRVSALYSQYDEQESEAKFDSFLKAHRGEITVNTFFQYCKDAGIVVRPVYEEKEGSNEQPPPKQEFKAPPKDNKETVRPSGNASNPDGRTPTPIPLMKVTSMNEALSAARDLPPMRRLMGTLLLENTLNIWGGDNGVGKSIIAFMAAEQFARGRKVLHLENECDPLVVLLCDYELVPKGLLKRYSDEVTRQEYEFSPNVYRADFNPDFSNFGKNYDDVLFAALRDLSMQVKANVLIIDNLTALKSQSNSDGDVALDLMNRLNRLKKELGLTIIVLTHVTKLPSNVPLVKNHIAGSKHIQNLCDSIVGIAKSSQGDNKIYIKELKNRYEEEAYGDDNVIVCRKVKTDSFLTVELVEFDVESNHISPLEEGSPDATTDKAKAIEMRKSGISIRKIAVVLGKSKSSVGEWVKDVRPSENPSNPDGRTVDEREDTPY